MPSTSAYIKDTSFEDFDPNDINNAQIVWGLYDGTRFRTFAKRPHALNAMKACYRGKLYWMQPDGKWLQIGVADSRWHVADKPCDDCGETNRCAFPGYSSPWVWRKVGGKIPSNPEDMDLVYLCSTCRSMNG